MSQDFIQAEAQKHSDITNEAKSFLAQGLPDSTQDTNSLGNLIGATAGTIILSPFVKTTSQSFLITIIKPLQVAQF